MYGQQPQHHAPLLNGGPPPQHYAAPAPGGYYAGGPAGGNVAHHQQQQQQHVPVVGGPPPPVAAGGPVYDEDAHTGDPEKDLAYERQISAGPAGVANYRSQGSTSVDMGHQQQGRTAMTVPDEVVDYLRNFRAAVERQDVATIRRFYEQEWPYLTDKYFRERYWPQEKKVAEIVGVLDEFAPLPGRLFMLLYKEMYFRHVYMRSARGPSLANRYDSFMNYQDLFNQILVAHQVEPIELQLPNVWLWDIIDEFVYQFQSFCLYKANPGKRSSEEVDDLRDVEEHRSVWNIYPVLNILISLTTKSQINEQLIAINNSENPEDVADVFGRHTLYFRLGYFSLIGLLRTHVLLGDYYQALRTVENLEFDAKGMYNNVPTCLVTLHYFVGFCHMMLRNYSTATRIFVNCMSYIQRTKAVFNQVQQQKKAQGQYDVISKTNEQLYCLLAICLTIQPQRIDESVQSILQETQGDRMARLAKGDMDEFKMAFMNGCPKFLSPTTVQYEGQNMAKEPMMRQCAVFMEGIDSQIFIPILRGYLKLYTTLPMRKLANFMDVADADYDSFVGKLLAFKDTVCELGKEGDEATAEDDSTADLDFYIDKDMICIADTKVARRVGEYFIKHIQKLQEVNEKLKRLGEGAGPRVIQRHPHAKRQQHNM